ncbi:hypothetical protein [Endozoicomonas ascidiicola]|uniref:hypothetical protein n=1 Tax=Endozoicomonas ascidiicola TaxID=1698521 RepID=UPI000A9C3333|nr:hypothetical protein [Endozoicomonas ascidiicola]
MNKTPGDCLCSTKTPLLTFSMFGLNTDTAYLVAKPGSKIATTDSGLPSTISPSNLSHTDEQLVAQSLGMSEKDIRGIDSLLQTVLEQSIATEPVHKANKRLGAIGHHNFELNTLLQMRPGEEKCYARNASINPRIDLFPFAGILEFLQGLSETAKDLTTLWLSAGVEISQHAQIIITRNTQGELVAAFSIEYCVEPSAEFALDPYWMDSNEEKKTDGTAFAFLYTSLSIGLKAGFKRQLSFTIDIENEKKFLEALLGGTLNIEIATECAKSASIESTSIVKPTKTNDDQQKQVTLEKVRWLNLNGSFEIEAGAGVASGHMAATDKLESEVWFWPSLELLLNSDIYKCRDLNSHSTFSRQHEGPSYIELSAMGNVSLVSANNILGQGEHGQDIWFFCYPMEVDTQTFKYQKNLWRNKDHASAIKAKLSIDEHSGLAFYELTLGTSNKDLRTIKRSLVNAGVTNQEVFNIIRSIVSAGANNYSLNLIYSAEPFKRQLTDITHDEYKLSTMTIYEEKKAVASPVGLRTDMSFKLPFFHRSVNGTASFTSLISQIAILNSSVEIIFHESHEVMKKEAAPPQHESQQGLRYRKGRKPSVETGSLLSVEHYV